MTSNSLHEDGDRRASGKRGSASFWLPAAATIGAAVFGTYAQKIAVWVVCGHSTLAWSRPCSAAAKAEALNIGTLIATMIAVAGAAAAANRSIATAGTSALTIAGALAGALFALIDAAWDKDVLEPSLLPVPLYFYFVCVVLFAIPFFCSPRGSSAAASAVALYLRLAAAVLVGAVLGYAAQLGAELYWKGLNLDGYGAQKFVVAASATAIAVGAWTVAMCDPYLRPWVWVTSPRWQPRLWVALYAVGAVVLAGGYGVLFHAPGGSDVTAKAQNALAITGLALPSLGAVALVLALRRSAPFGWRSAVVASLIAGATAAAISVVFAVLKVGRGMPSGADVAPFVVAQVLASVAAVVTAFITHRVAGVWSGKGFPKAGSEGGERQRSRVAGAGWFAERGTR